MKCVWAELVEKLTDGVASVSLGGAVGFSVFHVVAPVAVQPALGAYAAAAALIAYWASQWLFGLVGRRATRSPVARTELCDALIVKLPTPVAAPESKPEPEPDAVTDSPFDSTSVVQMFDPATISARGPSTARAGGLPGDLSPAVPADASRSLHEALDQLRERLR